MLTDPFGVRWMLNCERSGSDEPPTRHPDRSIKGGVSFHGRTAADHSASKERDHFGRRAIGIAGVVDTSL